MWPTISAILIVFILPSINFSQDQDTVRLLKPIPDQVLIEDQELNLDYQPFLELKLHRGVIQYEIRYNWVRDPGFSLNLDTEAKRLKLVSFDPYWGDAKVRLFYKKQYNAIDSVLLDEFIVKWTQVKDDPISFMPYFGKASEDVPVTLDLDSHFYDLDGLRPYIYKVLKVVGNVEASIRGRLLEILPKPNASGIAEITVNAANTLDSQKTENFKLNFEPVNDPPYLIKPLPDTSLSYFEALDVFPLRHYKEVDDSDYPFHNHVLSFQMDSGLLAIDTVSSEHFRFRSIGPLGAAWYKLNAIDPQLGPYTTQARIHNNAAWIPARKIFLPGPKPFDFDYYPARPDFAWIDFRLGILRFPTSAGSILIDPSRRLLTPPFKLAPGTCIAASPSGRNENGPSLAGTLWFIGKVTWPPGVSSQSEPGVDQAWAYKTVVGHDSWSSDPKYCLVEPQETVSSFKVFRWGASTAGISVFDKVSGPEYQMVLPDSAQILDILPFGNRLLILRKVMHTSGNELDEVWLDAYDASILSQTFSKSPMSIRVSKYDPYNGNTSLISSISWGKLWSSGKGVEVFWGKVDKAKASDFYAISAGSRLYRMVFDSSLSALSQPIPINKTTSGADYDIRIVSIDLIAPDEAIVYWVNNSGSCFDQFLSSTRINPIDPSKSFPETSTLIEDCGIGTEKPFTISYHFIGGRSMLTYGMDLQKQKYLQFSGSFPSLLIDKSQSKAYGQNKIGISWGILPLNGKLFDVKGRSHRIHYDLGELTKSKKNINK